MGPVRKVMGEDLPVPLLTERPDGPVRLSHLVKLGNEALRPGAFHFRVVVDSVDVVRAVVVGVLRDPIENGAWFLELIVHLHEMELHCHAARSQRLLNELVEPLLDLQLAMESVVEGVAFVVADHRHVLQATVDRPRHRGQ